MSLQLLPADMFVVAVRIMCDGMRLAFTVDPNVLRICTILGEVVSHTTGSFNDI